MNKTCFLICLQILAFTIILAQKPADLPPGYPNRSSSFNALPGFIKPPKGYGEVSFYWWLGDTLTKERITSQLKLLKNKSITGLQVNYCHTDKGGATYGLTYPSQPKLFSDKWWDLFQWFLKEAKKYDMSVSLSDYTLGAAGQGWYIDEMLAENPGLYGTKLESKQFDLIDKKENTIPLPNDILCLDAYRFQDGQLQVSTQINLLSNVRNNTLNWTPPEGSWKLVLVHKTVVKSSFDPMNPLSGQKVVEKLYKRFEEHSPGESGKGLNFFFSDELQFGIRGWLWNNHFAENFKKQKGYDITKKLEQLFFDIGPETYKTRLDYSDVMVSLTEDGFFKPVYNWHNDHKMLFGCDHGGRGRDITEFGDYFRTQRWLSGPGCDQPNLSKDIVKAKVASSIAHMYERPRTWLEGYYGSGWGTSSAEVADATFSDFAMGHNLLSLHALYYSTHGSMWEWAAPDNHFRQPYWENMGSFLKCSERLSYILSQGHHRCDVAMIYPVAPSEANLHGKESSKMAFDIAYELYPKGIDFDYMDFQSLDRCQIQNKSLNVSGEQYKVLILPSLSAVRYATIEKALEFYRKGGIVLTLGLLPEASDRIGANDPKLQAMIKEIFGVTYEDKIDSAKIYTTKSKAGGIGMYINKSNNLSATIENLIEQDFKILPTNVKSNILHRKIGARDLYFVYGVPKGTECFFRATGKVELWNPWNGTVRTLKVKSISKTGTTIELPLEKNEPQLIVFNPGKAEMAIKHTAPITVNKIKLDDNWEFEIKPTLDNTYGDYRLPAYNAKIGVEIWKLKFLTAYNSNVEYKQLNFEDSKWTTAEVTYGPQFLKLGPFPADTDFDALENKLRISRTPDLKDIIEINGKQYNWVPYEFSWRRGLKNDAGHQGYHGMKGFVNNEIVSFGIMDKSKIYKPVYPLNKEAEGSVYYMWSTVFAPKNLTVKINKDGLVPTKVFVNNVAVNNKAETVDLKAGDNSILLKYSDVGRGYYILEDTTLVVKNWKQMVPLATDWFLKTSVLNYNCFPNTKGNNGWYRFMSPPGAKTMYISSKTKPTVWILGTETPCESTKILVDQLADPHQQVWKVTFPSAISKSSNITLRIAQLPGYFGGAAILEPITFECGKGEIQLGDLEKDASLQTYSGGMWYRKTITITKEQNVAKNITLDLGAVVASANLFVNGKLVGQKVSSPWTFELSSKLKEGTNRIEVLVYNTLGNHYLNTPSQYVGRTNSGLIGPVTLTFK